MPTNAPSQEYFHSWAAILSQFYGHEDIVPAASVNAGADIARVARASDLPIVLTYWPHNSGRATEVVNFRFENLEVCATGNFFDDLEEPDNYTPIVSDMPVNDHRLFTSDIDALMSEEGYYTMSYFYDEQRSQIRFHLLFDPRTVSFRNEEERGTESIPARRVLMRVESIIRQLVIAHNPFWANEQGEISDDYRHGYFLEPDPRRIEEAQNEQARREEQERLERERQEREREALIDRLASAFSHTRHDERVRLEQTLSNQLYEIEQARRRLRNIQEDYQNTLKEILSLGHQSVDDLKASLRAYADSINLEKLTIQDRVISYTVDRFEIDPNGQHDFDDPVEIGPFVIIIDRQTLGLTLERATHGEETLISRGGHIHPHVNTDGMVCWGGTSPNPDTPSGRQLVAQIMRRRNVFELLFYAIDFFKNGYNASDAYEQLSGWRTDPHEDQWYCDHCETYHDNGTECPEICPDCGEYVDWSLHRHCPEHGCYDLECFVASSRDPANYEHLHLEHCPMCIEEREEREEREREEREREEREREKRELALAEAEDAADAAGGNVTLTPDDIESDQEQEQEPQESQEQEEQEREDVPF